MKLSQFRCLFAFQKGATCPYVSNNTHTSKLVGNLSSDHNKYVHQIILMGVVVKVNERVKFRDIFRYTFSFLSVLEMATDVTLTELQYNVSGHAIYYSKFDKHQDLVFVSRIR